MKKLFLALAIFGFITFGALGIQNLNATSYSTEMVKFDKDPKKDGDKKSKDAKATTEMKAESSTSTSTSSAAVKDDCCSSSSKSSSCCSKSGDDCSKGCPDKK